MVLLIILFNQRTHVASSYKYLATAMSSFCSFFLVFSNRTCQVFCLARSYKPPHSVAFFFFCWCCVFSPSIPFDRWQDLPGVGWKLRKRLNEEGLNICSDLWPLSAAHLQKGLGLGDKTGQALWEACRGIDKRSVQV